MDVLNCPNCGEIYLKNSMRDVCDKCYRKEEADFDLVYRFLRKRENRTATIEQVKEATDVDESLLYKWVRRGRLHPAQFPNLAYPCDKCGRMITDGKLCEECMTGIKADLATFDQEQERIEKLRKSVYYSQEKK